MAIELRREAGDRYGEAKALTHLAGNHHAAGDIAAARLAWQHALTLLDELHHADANEVRVKLHQLDNATVETGPAPTS